MFRNEIEKAFFKDMLAKGVPVKDDLKFSSIFEVLEKAAIDFGDYDASFTEQVIKLTDKNAQNFLTIKTEVEDSQRKIIFYTTQYDLAFERADLIMRTVFLIVTTCINLDMLDINSMNPGATEEVVEFDSDFV